MWGLHMKRQNQEKKERFLANGLIGSKAKMIHGQLTVEYINFNKVKINLWRKLHSGLPDVEFSVEDTDLPEIIELLVEAKKKIDESWLSKISAQGLQTTVEA